VRFIHALIGLVLFLSLAVAAAAMIYLPWFQPKLWLRGLRLMESRPWLASVLGAIGFVLIIVFLLSGVRRREPGDAYLSFESGGGDVRISVRAVRDFIAKMSDEFAAILSLHPRLQARGDALFIELEIKVRSGTQIPELCRMLQERIRETMKDHFGLTDIRDIKVNVKEIVSAPPVPLPEEALPSESRVES